MKDSAINALRTIASFPVTDPKNQDAINIRAIAVSALTSLKNELMEVKEESKLKRIIEAVADTIDIDPAKIKSSSYLRLNLRMDNLDIIELHMRLEETFELTIPDAYMDKFKKVSDILDFMNLYKNED